MHPDDAYQNNSIDNLRYKAGMAIRYADILLMYAGAINEVVKVHMIFHLGMELRLIPFITFRNEKSGN